MPLGRRRHRHAGSVQTAVQFRDHYLPDEYVAECHKNPDLTVLGNEVLCDTAKNNVKNDGAGWDLRVLGGV